MGPDVLVELGEAVLELEAALELLGNDGRGAVKVAGEEDEEEQAHRRYLFFIELFFIDTTADNKIKTILFSVGLRAD